MNILEERKAQFSMDKFMSMPRCTGAWTGPNGSGCLLTAFWRGLGISPLWVGVNFPTYQDATNDWAKKSGFVVSVNSEGERITLLTPAIITLNDNGREAEALALLLSFMRHVGLINENAEYEPVVSRKAVEV